MRLGLIAALMIVAGATPAVAASAGPDAGKRLGQCFVDKSTGQDRVDLMRWLMVNWAMSARIKDVFVVDPAVREKADKAMAALVMRMMTVDCVDFARPILKAHDDDALGTAFGTFGEIAGNEIGNDKDAAAATQNFGKYLDEKALDKLGE